MDGLAIRNPRLPEGISSSIEHLPFAEAALAGNVTQLESESNPIPPFEDGYSMWCQACDSGQGGVWKSSVDVTVRAMEEVISKARPN